MEKIKVMCVFGTRPEGIKMAPVVLALRARPEIETQVVVTGQHREMLDQVMGYFGISADEDLDIMRDKQSLTDITVRTLTGLEGVLEKRRPHILLVQGDTSTAFVAALAAFYHKIPVGHIEAGLRTDDKYNPFPEEMNRRLISSLGDLHFAPTREAFDNLMTCGTDRENVCLTGNTVVDALQLILEKRPVEPPAGLADRPAGRRMLFVETHRRENLGEPMRNICRALKRIVSAYPDTEIVFSVHKNPLVREVVFGELEGTDRITLLEPVDYPVMISLMKRSYFVLTDSGGLQEEAPSLGSPVLILRENTERPEGVRAGNSKLVGTDSDRIFSAACELLENDEVYRTMSQAVNPYGDGLASGRIADSILFFFGKRDSLPEFFGG